MPLKTQYDLVVVGAGHAGCEAAHAAARMGLEVLLLALQKRHVALMSCNPSIGGLGKGHLTREIDALGGLQAIATDATGIQFRVLNTRKGPAVQAPRAQCDKLAYNQWMRQRIEATPGVTLASGMASDLIVEPADDGHPRVIGVRVADGAATSTVRCNAVICATGTFLDGRIHIGLESRPSGRLGEPTAVGLSDAFERSGLEIGRLKTGTPPRLRSGSIDFSKFQIQPGDDPIPPFSFATESIAREQVCCWIGYTNESTHEIIRGGLDRSPLFTGVIRGAGPRYCPSIEDKIVRFPDKPRHQIFLEPEGLGTDWIYPNGLPTSLPADVQEAMVRSVPGLERVEIIRPGYAVEYTYCPPHQLHPTLETKPVRGLYFAGQLNGTSGYEEAAAQGFVAGVNVALRLKDRRPLVLGRDQAYIGVLIDDLITMEHREPYRMFTSRAEFRLLLRHDTADLRLTPIGRRMGLVEDERWAAFEAYREKTERELARMERERVHPNTIDPDVLHAQGLPVPAETVPLRRYLARPEVTLEKARDAGLISLDPDGLTPDEAARSEAQVLLQVKYAGYIEKQRQQVERMHRMGDKPLPEWLDYNQVHGLRREAREKLNHFRPDTVGQASRIAGINATDLSLVLVHLKSRGSTGT